MEYEEIYNRFLSRAKDKKLTSLSDKDYAEIMSDYLHNSLGQPYVRRVFSTIEFDDDAEELTYELKTPIDSASDDQFVIGVLSQAMVIEWMSHNLDADLYLALAIGGKEEKVLKNDLKTNYSRIDYLKKELQRYIRNHGYYNGTYTS